MQMRREWVGLVLVLAGLLRAGVLIAHDPVAGYANQYDMVRTSTCTGLYPATKDPEAATPDAPIAVYKRGGPRTGTCYMSTEVAVDAAVMGVARLIDKESRVVPLRWIGYAKLALLATTALLFAFALHRHPAASLIHGLVFLGVIADPAVTLWFNPLYTEFGVIWGLYAGVGAACALAATDRGRYAMWAVLVFGILGLALSREQLALLAPAIVLAAAPWLWQRSAEMTVVSFLIAIAACLTANTVAPRPGVVAHANRADAYLGVVLPASSRPQRALAILGLPDRCGVMIGATWYLQRGENIQLACPEVFELSSVAFLRFASEEPEVLARVMARGIPTMQALTPAYLGALEGTAHVAASKLPWWGFSPLDAAANRMPGKVFAAFVWVSMLAAPLALLAAIAWARPARGHEHAGLLLAMLLGGTVIYEVLTTLFGDGLSESARHFMPGALAMYALLIAFLASVPALIARWIAAPKARAFEIAAGVAVLPIVALSCATAFRWAEAEPLAIGILDTPAGRAGTLPATQLRGWALDPLGVESVQVELGSLKRDARVGIASPALKPLFPGYPDAGQAYFALDLGPEDLALAGAPAPLPMRITVRGRGGAVTEIDRRRLEFPK
ncbi:MAG TPA: hypothetical protein VII36_09970 [Usitatibacter sp.]